MKRFLGVTLLMLAVLGAACPMLATGVRPAAAASQADISALSLPSHRAVGFYVPDVPWDMGPLATLQSQVGFNAAFSNYFQNVLDPGFAKVSAGHLVAQGTVPMVTLEFYDPTKDRVNQPAFSLKRISSGACDPYLHAFARDVKAFGSTVWIRPLHEMNGNWYPWCGTVNGNSPADFVPAWRHIHDIFAEEGATNVKFVWCPNIDSHDANHSMTNPANAISSYWPGEEYVDIIAMDGYNFGTPDGGTWRSFASLYTAPYAEVCGLSDDKPILVAETSCATIGGDKAAWIRDMFATVPASFPRVVGLGWFNTIADRDWRVDSSASSLDAFRGAVHNATWSDLPATGLSIRRSASRVKRGRTFTISGRLSPARAGDRVRVYVRKKGSSRWSYSVATCDGAGAWRARKKQSKRGVYYFYARFPTCTSRWGSTSQTVSVSVR